MGKLIDITYFSSGATEDISVPAVIKVIAKAKEEHFAMVIELICLENKPKCTCAW